MPATLVVRLISRTTRMESFLRNYEYLLSRSLNYGGQNLPRGMSPREYFRDAQTARRFYAACHRGFEKSQRLAIQMIKTNQEDQCIDLNERTRRELIIRKAMDGIAYMMTMTETHVMRRLCIHEYAPGLDIRVVDEAIVDSERLNAESRQTFALVADLTTFVHICDLLRIDLRAGPPKIELIELKSGSVNALLLEQLKEYPCANAGIEAVDTDTAVQPTHKAQAKRILRQKMRMSQAQEVLTSDVGIDPGYQIPIRLSEHEYVLDGYDQFLNDLCDEAVENGRSAGTVQHCIHIAAAYGKQALTSRDNARRTMQCLLHQHELRSCHSLRRMRSDYGRIIPLNQRYLANDALLCNLGSVPRKPFVLWGIEPEHILRIVSGQLHIAFCFDVISHMWLAKQCGIDMSLSSRAETARLVRNYGRAAVPMWGNRALTYRYGGEEGFVLGGHLSRLLNDLNCPVSVIRLCQGLAPTTKQCLRQFQTAVRLSMPNS